MTYRTAATASRSWARSRSGSSYWLLYLLALSAVICLPLAIRASGWVPEANRLVWTAFWGLAAGFVIAQARAPDWMTWLGSMVLAVEYSLQFAAKLAPSITVLLGDLVGAVQWLWRAVVLQQPLAPYPFARSWAHVATHAADFDLNMRAWLGAAQAGSTSEDLTVLWIVVSLAVWLLSWHAGYELIRHRRPFSALVPLGVAIVSNVSFTDVGLTYVHVYLGITLVTLVIANIDRLERLWQRLDLDFSAELRRDTLVAGVGITTVVLVIALLIPYRTVNSAVWFFWNRVGPSIEQFYDRLDKAFAGREPVPEPTPELASGLLGHRVASGGAIGDDTLFVVKVSDPAPPDESQLSALADMFDITQFVPKRYWRQRTFDVYTGSGWETSGREAVEVDADSAWGGLVREGDEVTQTYTLLELNSNVVPAVSSPVRVQDQDYAVVARNADDLAALVVNSETYTVVSVAPRPVVAALRAAEGPYPEWVAELHMALPEIPARVSDLAQEIVAEAGATTRYDKAVAIQNYLREFIYDLEVEPPGLDRDVVEYFLFDAQRGYCDYTATAAVVMLRSVGVAARYAQGFGQGQFNYDEGVYVVKELNRHAWPEVYFPGEGWIEFEPTPVQSVWSRPSTLGDLQGGAAPTPEAETGGSVPPILRWAALLAAVVLLVVIWPFNYLGRRHADPRAAVRQVYGRLVRAARWLNLEPRGGQTPGEYLAFLARQVEERARANGQAASDISVIANAYQAAVYSNRDLPLAARAGAEGAWARLRAPLRRAWFRRPKRGEVA
jgi:transglutaminase-like putative cysteine protease